MVACPGIRQKAPISVLIKPIGLCGTRNTQKIFLTRPAIIRARGFTPVAYINQQGDLSMGRYAPILGPVLGLISAEIGAFCRILGHATEWLQMLHINLGPIL